MPDKQTVLIIDDERDIVQGISVRLRAAGFEVLTAANGALGFDRALTSAPDCILLDIGLPEMDGIKLLELLKRRAETKHIPVAAISANTTKETRARAFACGIFRFVRKPFQSAELLSAVQAMIAISNRTCLEVATVGGSV